MNLFYVLYRKLVIFISKAQIKWRFLTNSIKNTANNRYFKPLKIYGFEGLKTDFIVLFRQLF
jgi:hypothetical protein